MADALAVFRKNPTEEGYRLALEAASATLSQRYEEQVEYSLEGLTKLFTKGFDAALNKTVAEELENETVVGVEVPIGEGRIDLVSRLKSNNALIITDDKLKMQINSAYLGKTLDEVEQDWQLWDYLWRATELYGEPVRYMRRHLIILSPKAQAHHRIFTVTPEAVEQQGKASTITWLDMERDVDRPLDELAMNRTQCINRYGKCEFFKACHELSRDESKFEVSMDRKERR